jgi:hypothetical protein
MGSSSAHVADVLNQCLLGGARDGFGRDVFQDDQVELLERGHLAGHGLGVDLGHLDATVFESLQERSAPARAALRIHTIHQKHRALAPGHGQSFRGVVLDSHVADDATRIVVVGFERGPELVHPAGRKGRRHQFEMAPGFEQNPTPEPGLGPVDVHRFILVRELERAGGSGRR